MNATLDECVGCNSPVTQMRTTIRGKVLILLCWNLRCIMLSSILLYSYFLCYLLVSWLVFGRSNLYSLFCSYCIIQEYTMLCMLCGKAEDSISVLPEDPRQTASLF